MVKPLRFSRLVVIAAGTIPFLSLSHNAVATNHIVRIDSVMAGLAGSPNVQFVQMVTSGNSQKRWGPQGGETEGRAMLVFFDASGIETGRFVFDRDPPSGQNTVLIATQAFADLPGAPTPDFIIPTGLIRPGSGKVCFKNNPANTAFTINLCLSYGSFTGNTEGAGPPAPALPISGQARSLNRVRNNGFGSATNNNSDFELGSPSPVNTGGQTFTFDGEAIDVSATALDFGVQPVSIGPPLSRAIEITNNGMQPTVTISNIEIVQGPEPDQLRILSDTGEATLFPDETRTLTIVFDPSSAGPKIGLLSIFSDSGNRTVMLSGRGVIADACFANDPAEAVPIDDCALAQIVCPDIVFSGSTADATNDGSSSCGNSGTSPDVWFRYAPAVSGTLDISLAGSSFNTVLSVHSNCLGTVANEIACDDDGGGGTTSRIGGLQVTEGETIFIRIAGSSGETGDFQMLLTGPPCFDFDRDGDGIVDACQIDWGDAPAPYATLMVDDGARHRTGTGLFLGARIDTEGDGLPHPNAAGDNFDGPPNDDDGVAFDGRLLPGGTMDCHVTASSGGGLLHAWIDFNRDGDWGDAGEQVCADRPLAQGLNVLAISIPANADSGSTFARFRVGTESGLAPTGEAEDGEVEDHLVEISDPTAIPSDRKVRIGEIMAGVNGDSSVQFVELEVEEEEDKDGWGPQGGETAGRAALEFADPSGTVSGRFVFPADPPAGGSSILVATQAFADLTGIAPDFVMPEEVMAIAGQVVFRDNPENSHYSIRAALSYGAGEFSGATYGAGPPNLSQLPAMGAQSLARTGSLPFGTGDNAPYALAVPTPTGTQGQTFSFTAKSIEDQGEVLFFRETFRGNGRTCATCHQPGADQFGLTPGTIASLSPDDPLFISEFNLNTLLLTSPSQPSDLRGAIAGSSGSGRIVAGSGDRFFVHGGAGLSGTVTDASGNSAMVQSVTPGDLATGPTNSNGSPSGLEIPARMRSERALILENIDGFEKKEVFRSSPHLLNIAETAPYGLSGEFADLRSFSRGAVAQHFPRTLERVSGIDFREPTEEELLALEAFQNSIRNPSDADFSLDKFATTQAQKRGRELFFGEESKCSKCHSGSTLGLSDGTLPGSIMDFNESFNTGVANRHENMPEHANLPTEPAGLIPGQSTREFNTPPLFGIKVTAPFFHDGSFPDLKDAVEFYDTPDFIGSPAGLLIGEMEVFDDPQNVLDMVAFLESLVEIPVEFTRNTDFGRLCSMDPPPGAQILTITNTEDMPISIEEVIVNGPNANEFVIMDDTQEAVLNPGESRVLQVEFAAIATGQKVATVEVTANVASPLGRFRFGMALEGTAASDSPAFASINSFDFHAVDVEEGPSTEFLVVDFTNLGFDPLAVEQVGIVGPDSADFFIETDTGESMLAFGQRRTLTVRFDPGFSGQRHAVLRFQAFTCDNEPVDVELGGVGLISLDHFVFSAVPGAVGEGVPVPVQVEARAANAEVVTSFNGTEALSAFSAPPSPILVSEVDTSPNQAEFTNVSTGPVDVGGWTIFVYGPAGFPDPGPPFVIPGPAVVAPGSTFRLLGGGISPGALPDFSLGSDMNWVFGSSEIAILLVDGTGSIVDFFTTGNSAAISIPSPIPVSEWNGLGAPVLSAAANSHTRTGAGDSNDNTDWSELTPTEGALNPGLSLPFGTAVSLLPGIVNFVNGAAAFNAVFPGLSEDVRIGIDDGAGHLGSSNEFDVTTVIEAWLIEHFTEAERNDPLVTGFETDIDFDDRSLFAEYAFGTNPRLADGGNIVDSDGVDFAAQTVRLSFLVRVSDSTLAVDVLQSGDLESWISAPFTLIGDTATGIPGVVRRMIEVDVPTESELLFYVVAVTR